MSWSIKILQIGDTALRVHLTFPLLLLWVAAASYPSGGVVAAIDGVVFVLLIFVCVVLHELGHVIAAQHYGIRTPEITVLPIGGLARLERLPRDPSQELVVAAAGPLVNVVLAVVLAGLLGARFDLSTLQPANTDGGVLLGQLLGVNLMLVVFNLIPAFPLDGGRIFRALLAYVQPRHRATRLAARIGQTVAVLFAGAGLLYNPFLILIAVFMFFAAEAEADHESMLAETRDLVARDAMITRFESLGTGSVAADASNLLLQTTQQEFPVIDATGRVAGFVTRTRLIDAMTKHGSNTPVCDIMRNEVTAVAPDAALERVIAAIYAHPARAVAVVDREGRLLGYVNGQNATELMMLKRGRKRR